MPLGWPTPVVCPSWSLAKPAGHTLSSIYIFQTRTLYTDSYQIFHCGWMKGYSSAVLLKPPLKPIKNPAPPSHHRLPNHFTKHYEKKVFCLIASLCSYCILMQRNSQSSGFTLYILLFLLSVNGKNMKQWLKQPFEQYITSSPFQEASLHKNPNLLSRCLMKSNNSLKTRLFLCCDFGYICM